MAKFIVPLFVTRESKIIGPFTFMQFVFVALAGGICFILYFIIGKKNLVGFIFLTLLIIGSAVALAFMKVGGHPLPMVFKDVFNFFLSPRIFLWHRKIVPPRITKVKKVEEKKEEEAPLKIVKKSNLYRLSVQVETKKMR
jgi:hypothetical protein